MKFFENKVHALYDRHPTLLARYPSIYAVPIEARLKRSTLVLQMWLKQVLQQEHLTDISQQKARMDGGSIQRFLQPRDHMALRQGADKTQSHQQRVFAVAVISKWWTRRVRFRPRVVMPRMGIGDPG